MRSLHLYLGCIFAPMMIFFVISGCLQTFQLTQFRKDGYRPPEIFQKLADIHTSQQLGEAGNPSQGFKIFILVMSVAFLVTTFLGVVMALKFASPGVVWGCLSAGILIPILLLKFL